MNNPIKVALLGLDTSHSVEFQKLIHDPNIPLEHRVFGLTITKCLRFETPFQNQAGLDQRQAYLESIGMKVTENFEEAVADCEAIMLVINDPTRHLEFFEKCARLGKPIFLDKPFADSLENAKKICKVATEYGIRFFTASSLRFDVDFTAALAQVNHPRSVKISGPIYPAAAGSSIIWYGTHVFDMIQRTMGRGAATVSTIQKDNGYICQIRYQDGRQATAELIQKSPTYSGIIQDQNNQSVEFRVIGGNPHYQILLNTVDAFFRGGETPVAVEDSLEVTAMLVAADRSAKTITATGKAGQEQQVVI